MDFDKEIQDIKADIDRIGVSLKDRVENRTGYPLSQILKDLDDSSAKLERADASLMKNAKELAGLRSEIKTLHQVVKGLTGEEW